MAVTPEGRRRETSEFVEGDPLGQRDRSRLRFVGGVPGNRRGNAGQDEGVRTRSDAADGILHNPAVKSKVGTDLAKMLLQRCPSGTSTQDPPAMPDALLPQPLRNVSTTDHPFLSVAHPAEVGLGGVSGCGTRDRRGRNSGGRVVAPMPSDHGFQAGKAADEGEQMGYCAHTRCGASIADDLFASSE